MLSFTSPLSIKGLLQISRSSDGVRRLLTGAGTGGIAMILNKVATIASAVIFARLLGVEGYGIFAIATSGMTIALIACEFGLPSLLVREIARSHVKANWSRINGLLHSARRFFLTACVLAASLALVTLILSGDRIDVGQRWAFGLAFVFLLPLSGLLRMLTAALNGLRRLAAAQVTELALAPLLALLIVGSVALLGVAGLQAYHAVAIQIAASATAVTIAGIWLAHAVRDGRNVPPAIPGHRALLTQSWPFLALNIASLLSLQIDVVMVNLFVSNEATGLYRVASQGALLAFAGLQLVTALTGPYFARLHASGDTDNLRRLFRTAQLLGFLFAATTLGAYALFGQWLIGVAFGEEFLPAYPYLLILTAGFVANHAFGPSGALMSMCGHERKSLKIMWVAGSANVIACAIAAWAAGALGVAVVTAICLASYNLAMYIAARKNIGI